MTTTVTLTYGDTPKSLNVVGTRSNHWAVNSQKRLWQGIFEGLLMASGLPRGLESAEASAVLRFPTRRRRDIDNHSFILAKSLGDAMKTWIPDDTPEYWRFFGVSFDPEPGPAKTTVTVIGRHGIERGVDQERAYAPNPAPSRPMDRLVNAPLSSDARTGE